MSALTFPLSGSTLILGPSNVGKTRITACALDRWVTEHGPCEVTVLEFAPEIERDGRLLGGRLTRFVDVPETVWYGVLDAYAPRSAGGTDAEAIEFAGWNAEHAGRLLDAAPESPDAVFVNDATIMLQSNPERVNRLIDYCERAEVAVLNAFESTELGVDDPVSRNERIALDTLRSWTDRVVERG